MTIKPMYDFTRQVGEEVANLVLERTELDRLGEKMSPDKAYVANPDMAEGSSVLKYFLRTNAVVSGHRDGVKIVSSNNDSSIGDTFGVGYSELYQEVNMEYILANRIGSRISLSYRRYGKYDNDSRQWGIITGYKDSKFEMAVFWDGTFTGKEVIKAGDREMREASDLLFPEVRNHRLPFSSDCVFSITEEAEKSLGVAPGTRFRYLNHDLEEGQRLAFTVVFDGKVRTVYGEDIVYSTRDYALALPEMTSQERKVSHLNVRRWNSLLSKRDKLIAVDEDTDE